MVFGFISSVPSNPSMKISTASVSEALLLPGVGSLPPLLTATDAVLMSRSLASPPVTVAEYTYAASLPTGNETGSLNVLPMPLAQLAPPNGMQTQLPLISPAGSTSVTVAVTELGPATLVTSMM